MVAVASKFAASHPDAYDQLVIWTDRPVLFGDDGFAYAIGVANDIRGIGLPIHDDSADFGSETPSSVVVMGWLGKYSDDRSKKVIGEGTTLGTLAHESGHPVAGRARVQRAPTRPRACTTRPSSTSSERTAWRNPPT